MAEDDYEKSFDEAVMTEGGKAPETPETSKFEDEGAVDKAEAEEPISDSKELPEPAQAAEDATVTQKYKSLQGMFNYETKRRLELEARLKELEEGRAAKAQPKPEAETATDTDSNVFRSEYPEIHQAMSSMNEKQAKAFELKLKELADSMSAVIQPVVKNHQATDEARHFGEIKQAHEDFESLATSGEVLEWVNTLPAYKQEAYHKVYNQGTAAEVIDLFKDYKEANAITPVNKQPSAVNTKKLATMETVRTKHTAISTRPSIAAKDDYTGAWAEAPG